MGRSKVYTDEQIDFLKNETTGLKTPEITRIFNDRFKTSFTPAQIKSTITRHKIKTNAPKGNPTGFSKIYTPEIKQFIKDNVVGRTINDLVVMINKEFGTDFKYGQIKGFCGRFGLTNGVCCHFKAGEPSWIKGKRLPGTAHKATQFKTGFIPHNTVSVGTEVVDTYGYTKIKVADPNKWKFKHHLVWEEVNGPIPKGHKLIFGDGNKNNFDIDNFLLVSNRQMAVLNQKKLIKNHADLTRAGLLIADIHSKISNRKKKK